MNLEDTLLYGIQQIPGDIAGEKFKYINKIAIEVAANNQIPDNFPESLKPLLNVEVAKLLNKTDIIIEALRTSDALLCHRALQIPDLFPDENCALLEWNYFNSELLSRVSYSTRFKLIKKVSKDLQRKHPKYADNFYLEISKLYGQNQAYPLLLACSETLLHELISKNDIKLSAAYVRKLFLRYPNFVISYLHQYTNILPKLLRIHFDIVIEFCNSYKGSFTLKFGGPSTKIFLSKATQLLIENPKTYQPVLSLKIVSKRLRTEEFILMLSNLFPNDLNDFNYEHFHHTLKYFPDDKKVSFILLSFQKVYGENLYDYPDLITPSLLKILPSNERYKIARLKLEKDNDWHLSSNDEWEYKNHEYRNDFTTSWRAYLPFIETVDFIKSKIAKSSDEGVRMQLMKLLIYNCHVNKDKDAYLEVLKYMLTKYYHEEGYILNDWFEFMILHRAFMMFDESHWDIIIERAKQMTIKSAERSKYKDCASSILSLVREGVKFMLVNNLNPDEYIKFILKFKITEFSDSLSQSDSFNLRRLNFWLYDGYYETNFKFRKISAEKYMNLIPECYSINEIKQASEIITELLIFIRCCNGEVKEKPNDLELQNSYIEITDYPIFIQFIESTTLKLTREETYDKYYLKEYTKMFNLELFEKWFPNEENRCICKIEKDDIQKLKINYETILNDWQRYQRSASRYINSKSSKKYARNKQTDTIIFLKLLRWYKDLPIKFVNTSIQQIKHCETFDSASVLGILLDGGKYQDIIEPLIPFTPKLNLDTEESLNSHLLIEKCVLGIKFANIPVALDLFKRLFGSDFLSICEQSLYSITCRHPAPVVISFVTNLMHERVAVTKKMITILCTVATKEETLKSFEKILESKVHPSIHGAILEKALKMINTKHTEFTWTILQKCLEKRNIEDPRILMQISKLQSIPHQYIATYTEKVLILFENVQIEGYADLSNTLVNKVLGQLDESFATILSDQFQKELIQKYLFDRAFDDENPSLNKRFLFDVYLANNLTEEKMNFISDFLKNFLIKYFGNPSETENKVFFYRASTFFKGIVNTYVTSSACKQVNLLIVNCLFELFESVIKPCQDMESYLQLTWIKYFDTELGPKKFGVIFGQNLHVLISEFGIDYISKIVNIVEKFLGRIFKYNVNGCIYLYNRHNVLCRFICGLLEVQNNNSYICAALLLSSLNIRNDRFNGIIEELMQVDIPSVISITHDKIFSGDRFDSDYEYSFESDYEDKYEYEDESTDQSVTEYENDLDYESNDEDEPECESEAEYCNDSESEFNDENESKSESEAEYCNDSESEFNDENESESESENEYRNDSEIKPDDKDKAKDKYEVNLFYSSIILILSLYLIYISYTSFDK